MFGVTFRGHPHLRRILMPPTWEGHPLRKEHPARATEMGRYHLTERAGGGRAGGHALSPGGLGHGPPSARIPSSCSSTSGPTTPARTACSASCCSSTASGSSTRCRTSASTTAAPRRWASARPGTPIIPYTDRIDYLGGVMNNLPYVLAVEKLAGIEVPDRVEGDPHHDCRAVPHRQPPGLVRHLRPGRGRAVAGVLHVQRPRAGVRHHRGHLRRADAPELVPHRRCGRGPAPRVGQDGARVRGVFPAPPGRVRQDGDAKQHLPGPHRRGRRVQPGRGHRLGRDRAGAARLRDGVGFSQAAALFGLRQHWSSMSPPATRGDSYDRCAVRVEEMRQSRASSASAWSRCPRGTTSPTTR